VGSCEPRARKALCHSVSPTSAPWGVVPVHALGTSEVPNADMAPPAQGGRRPAVLAELDIVVVDRECNVPSEAAFVSGTPLNIGQPVAAWSPSKLRGCGASPPGGRDVAGPVEAVWRQPRIEHWGGGRLHHPGRPSGLGPTVLPPVRPVPPSGRTACLRAIV
jgi:hypothetical protein